MTKRNRGKWSMAGRREVPSSGPNICRRVGCLAPATDDMVQLCEGHAGEQWTLKQNVAPDPRRVLGQRRHGTQTAYSHGCRCGECRTAHAVYYADRRKAAQ